jgi:hypothetical protein
MLKQEVIFNFSTDREGRQYNIFVRPNSPWTEVDDVLNEFKSEFAAMQEQALKVEQEKNKDKEIIDTPVSE